MLKPISKHKKTIILDIDDTLTFCVSKNNSNTQCDFYCDYVLCKNIKVKLGFNIRPHLMFFL